MNRLVEWVDKWRGPAEPGADHIDHSNLLRRTLRLGRFLTFLQPKDRRPLHSSGDSPPSSIEAAPVQSPFTLASPRTTTYAPWSRTPSYDTSKPNVIPRSAVVEQSNLLLSGQEPQLSDFTDIWPVTCGASCDLYSATYQPKNTKIAMKRLRINSSTGEIRQRAHREAEIWSRLKHPNILPFLGIVDTNHGIYLLSLWMSRGDLFGFARTRVRFLQGCSSLSDDSIPSPYRQFDETRTIREIASGLEYLHSTGVVHGDMKGRNILLDDYGGALLCDFGLSKIISHRNTAHATISLEQGDEGFIRWQAPELLKDGSTSSMSDIYAFGITIAEILTGDYPFSHLKGPAAVLQAIMIRRERPAFQPLSRLGAGFEHLWSIAAICWEENPEVRPQAKDVVQRLGGVKPHPLTPDSVDLQADVAAPARPLQIAPAHNEAPIVKEPPGSGDPYATKPQDTWVLKCTTVDEISTGSASEPYTNHEVTSSTLAALNNTQLKLRLSDHDSHLVDLPNAPPVGGGGSGELYAATHRPTGAKLAMKCLRVGFPTKDALRRFLREAETWSQFEHENILPLFGIMNINHRIYMVSPWMVFGDLFTFVRARLELIKEHKLLSDESLVYSNFNETKTICELASGLWYLHYVGAIHGDVKARNALLDGNGCIKICDFGLTKTLDYTATSEEQQGAGSTRWQSPEVLKGSPKSKESDVYAFGMTITEVLTADYPFPNIRLQSAVISAVLIENQRPIPKPLSLQGVDFGPLWSLADQCWKKEAGTRPSMKAAFQYLSSLSSAGPQETAATFQQYKAALRQLQASSSSRLGLGKRMSALTTSFSNDGK